MIRCIAIDDEPRALEVIRTHVSRVPFLILEAVFTDPYQAATFVNDQPVDLVFLDINMPDIDGLSLLKSFSSQPFIIFTTAHSEYALDSYEVAAVDYLLKPFDYSRFLLAVTKVKDRLTENPAEAGDFFFVNSGNQKRRIAYSEIVYLESKGNYVRYHTDSGDVLVRSSIRETIEQLPQAMFVQIHRSFIVPLQRIDKIKDNHVYIGRIKISIGATYRDHFMRLIDSLNR